MRPILLLLACIALTGDPVVFHPGAEPLVEDTTFLTSELAVGNRLRLGWNATGTTDPRMALATATRLDLIDYLGAAGARDWDGLAEMKRLDRTAKVPYGTPCLVLELQTIDVPGLGRPGRLACVRITEGELRGMKVWVEQLSVRRLIPKTKPPQP